MARAIHQFLDMKVQVHSCIDDQAAIDMITDSDLNDSLCVYSDARFVGEETLNRFYVLHCIAIPLATALLLAIHFWRVRKDGGITLGRCDLGR